MKRNWKDINLSSFQGRSLPGSSLGKRKQYKFANPQLASSTLSAKPEVTYSHLAQNFEPETEIRENISLSEFADDTIQDMTPDEKIPLMLSITSSRNFFSSTLVNFDNDILPDVSDASFERILKYKLNICTDIYDFDNPDPVVSTLREQKTSVLRELCTLFDNPDKSLQLSTTSRQLIWQVLYTNIFDQEPRFPSKSKSFLYTVQIIDPMWPHLVLAFQILNKYITYFPNDKCLTPELIKRAVYLTNLPDPNVRGKLLAFLKCILDKRLDMFHTITKAAGDQLLGIVNDVLPPYCATPLLQLIAYLYQKTNQHPPSAFNKVIQYVVLPLLSSQYFPTFASSFNGLITTILSVPQETPSVLPKLRDGIKKGSFDRPILKSTKSANTNFLSFNSLGKCRVTKLTDNDVYTALDKYWPRTCGTKALPFLETLFATMDAATYILTTSKVERICNFLANLLKSENIKVNNRILALFKQQTMPKWVQKFSKTVTDIFTPVLIKLKTTIAINCEEKGITTALQEILNLGRKGDAIGPDYADRKDKRVDRIDMWVALSQVAVLNGFKHDHAKFKSSVVNQDDCLPTQAHFMPCLRL